MDQRHQRIHSHKGAENTAVSREDDVQRDKKKIKEATIACSMCYLTVIFTVNHIHEHSLKETEPLVAVALSYTHL